MRLRHSPVHCRLIVFLGLSIVMGSQLRLLMLLCRFGVGFGWSPWCVWFLFLPLYPAPFDSSEFVGGGFWILMEMTNECFVYLCPCCRCRFRGCRGRCCCCGGGVWPRCRRRCLLSRHLHDEAAQSEAFHHAARSSLLARYRKCGQHHILLEHRSGFLILFPLLLTRVSLRHLS